MKENKNFNKEIKFGNHIQIKRGSGSPQGAKDSFKVGELGYDLTNNDLYIRAESDMVRIGSNIVDTATANSKDLITSHGVSVIKNQIDSDISSLENEVNNLKKSLVDLILPVGTVITNASSTFNPNKVYKGTTWTRIKGRVIVGVDESDTPFNKTNKTGGHKELQSHTHSAKISSGGGHGHPFSSPTSTILTTEYEGDSFYDAIHTVAAESSAWRNEGIDPGGSFNGRILVGEYEAFGSGRYDNMIDKGKHSHKVTLPSIVDPSGAHSHTVTINSSGKGNAGNLQPYITKYVWERTA